MDPLADRVRELFRADRWRVPADPDALERVHAGARRRRQRRTVAAGALAAALVVVGGGGTAALLTQPSPPGTLAVGQGPTRTASATAPSTTPPAGEPTRPSAASSSPAPTSPGPTTAPGDATPSGSPSSPSSTTTQQPPGAATRTFTATSVSAVDTDRLWALGAVGDSPQARVAATADGGATFDIVGTIPARVAEGTNEAGPDTVQALRFADESHGWAYGGALWTTADGGRSWHRVEAVPGEVRRLEVGAGGVFALATADSTWTLWRSAPGADSWRQLPVSLAAPEDLAVGDGAVAVTDRSAASTYVQVSTDGGDTFAAHATGCAPELSPGTLSGTADALWLTCPTGMSSRLEVSTDQGRSWSAVDIGIPGIPANASAVGARDASSAVVAAPGEVRLAAADGAAPRPVRVPGLATPTYAGFTTADVGYLVDIRGDLFRTTDGGHTWARLRVGR